MDRGDIRRPGPAAHAWLRAPLCGTWLGAGGGAGVVLVGFKVLPMVIIGGLDSLPGPLLGALVVGLLESLAAEYLDPLLGGGFSTIAAYLVVLVVLWMRPYGLCGTPDIEWV